MDIIRSIGRNGGLAFQFTDDILDATSEDEILGKPAGSDEEHEKTTYIKLFGLEGARTKAKELTQIAAASCKELKRNSDFLQALINHLEHRLT